MVLKKKMILVSQNRFNSMGPMIVHFQTSQFRLLYIDLEVKKLVVGKMTGIIKNICPLKETDHNIFLSLLKVQNNLN